MPIYRLFQQLAFDADHIDLMSTVFERVSLELGLGKREDSILAEAIIECAQRGARDSEEMRRCAHDVLQSA